MFTISKMSEIQICLKCPYGSGVNPNWDIIPNFLVFFSDASLNKGHLRQILSDQKKALFNYKPQQYLGQQN